MLLFNFAVLQEDWSVGNGSVQGHWLWQPVDVTQALLILIVTSFIGPERSSISELYDYAYCVHFQQLTKCLALHTLLTDALDSSNTLVILEICCSTRDPSALADH